MGFSRNHPARISISWEASTVHHLLFLVAVLWIAHFFCFRSFGLYEDDYAVISTPLSWDLPRVLSELQQDIATLPLGRPIGFFLTHFLAFIAGKIGGLRTAYIFGFLVQVTNVCLFYFLIKKISPETIAFIGALAFGLFPADTTHIFLTHSLGLHTSLTFLLIASLLYLSGKKILSYLFALGSLLTYESPYMVFLAIPLLGRNWDYKLAKEMGQHLVIWLAILVLVALIRFSAGEGRVVETVSSPANIGITFVHAMEAS